MPMHPNGAVWTWTRSLGASSDLDAEVEPVDVVPPVDPRGEGAAPAVMPVVEELDELTTRVLAPNPSPMTLDGTNTYVLGVQGTGELVVVDPGPDDPGHLARVAAVVADRRAEVRAVLLTHGHADHAEAAVPWARRFGCQVLGADVAGTAGRVIADGARIPVGGVEIEVVGTPGHTRDHVAFRIPTGALLTGDHVLGRGTTVIARPDGHLASYVDSLRRVLELGPDALFPGHGPAVTRDPAAVVDFHLAHRRYRAWQVAMACEGGCVTAAEVVERIYPQVAGSVGRAARATVEATLEWLVDHEVVRVTGPGSGLHELVVEAARVKDRVGTLMPVR